MRGGARYTCHMKIKAMSLLKTVFLLAALNLGMATLAHAQWGWTDKDGRRIFSDLAPAPDVPDKSIFKRPSVVRAPAATAVAAKTADAETTSLAPAGAAAGTVPGTVKPGAAAPKLTGKDAELEKKKKEAEDAVAAKKKEAETKFASQQADNCERAKKAKNSFASGVRIATTNAKGEREIMSDTDRAAESKRLDGVIATDCK
jgi:hypothetical protein